MRDIPLRARHRRLRAFQFLARSMDPYTPGDVSPAIKRVMDNIEKLRNMSEEKDHYSQTDAEPTTTER